MTVVKRDAQFVEVVRAEIRDDRTLKPNPPRLDGIKLRGVARQAMHAHAGATARRPSFTLRVGTTWLGLGRWSSG